MMKIVTLFNMTVFNTKKNFKHFQKNFLKVNFSEFYFSTIPDLSKQTLLFVSNTEILPKYINR